MLKRGCDLFFSLIGLPLYGPLCLLLSLAIRLDSRGPALFRQTRIGHRGKPFTVLKFRSMHVSATRAPASPLVIRDFHTFVFSPPGRDPRVTRLGVILRATSLDELPQFFNVLRGDMSIVGPRPELPEIVAQYPPEYHARHTVKPGITGLAQISGRSDLSYHAIMQHDLHYVRQHSIWLDLTIMLRSIFVVLALKGAR